MRYRSITKIALVLTAVFIFSFVTLAAAQQGPGNIANPIANPASNHLISVKTFGDLALGIINWMLLFAGGVVVLFLLVGGIRYIASRGNEEAMEKAKKTIAGAIIGLIIILMAFAIVTIVNDVVTHNPGEVATTPSTPSDTDGDGVPDSRDTCPNTPPNTSVNANGCPIPPPGPQCSDTFDNDGDGKTDFGQDPGCADATDNNEADPIGPPNPACSNNVDDDRDGKVDYPVDPGCVSRGDNDENDPATPLPLPTVTLSATPSVINANGSSNLTWTSTDADSCVAMGAWNGPLATFGTKSVGPLTATQSYSVVCTNASGLEIASVTVTVNAPSTPSAPTVTLNASPTTVNMNGSATLTWTSSGATSCTASWTAASIGTNSNANVGPLTSTQSYTVTCTNAAGSDSDTVVVAVNPPTPVPTVNLSANPTIVIGSAPATLTWSSTNATSCTASGAWTGTKQLNGSDTTGSLGSSSATFTLTCANASGQASRNVTVRKTACSNGDDDDSDFKADIMDRGCHSDGNAANASSYVASDDDETDPQTPQFYLDRYLGPFKCTNGVASIIYIGTIMGGLPIYTYPSYDMGGLPSPSDVFIDGPDQLAVKCLTPTTAGSGTAHMSVTLRDSSTNVLTVTFDVFWGP